MSVTSPVIPLLGLLTLVVPLMGVLMALTPYLMPKRECFAVTVPESAQADPQIRKLKATYARTIALMTVVLTIVAAAAAIRALSSGYTQGSVNALVAVVVLASLVPVVVSFVLMLRNRRKVMAIKRERGWHAPRQQAAALVAEDDVPGPVSLAWNLLYVPVILFVAALGVMWYPLMPDMIPMHADFAGNVDDYAPKGIGTLMFPVGVAAFLAVTFFICHVVMMKSKRPTYPGAPVTSALAYGLFARAQSVFLLAVGLLLSLVIGVAFMASSAGFITLGGAAAIITLACVPIVVGSVALSVVYGQSGSRLFRRMEAAGVSASACAEETAVARTVADAGTATRVGVGAEEVAATRGSAGVEEVVVPCGSVVAAAEDAPRASVMPLDGDEHWKLGIFYFNPDDASVWLPERFGIGWTMNLARPAAWAFIAGFTLVIVAFAVLVVVLVG